MIAMSNSAYRLHKAWPRSVLKLIPDAGHSSTKTCIGSTLIKATEQFKNTEGF